MQPLQGLGIDNKLAEINNLHTWLKFTMEREGKGSIQFLDIKIIHNTRGLSPPWYNKPTDTGQNMNYHALSPKLNKHYVVSVISIHASHLPCM